MESPDQAYFAKICDIVLIYSENRVILASVVLSQYTRVTGHDNRLHTVLWRLIPILARKPISTFRGMRFRSNPNRNPNPNSRILFEWDSF